MPAITRWFVKTSLVMLLLGLALGVYQQLPGTWQGGLFPVYLHLLVFGWLTQLIFGIALWMLPKYSSAQPRGYEPLNWVVYGCLNAGLVVRLVFEPLHASQAAEWSGAALIAAALLQWLSGMLFAGQAWLRVKGR